MIGKIKIGHNCKIGAKAFVNKAFEEDGVVLAGAPTKNIVAMEK